MPPNRRSRNSIAIEFTKEETSLISQKNYQIGRNVFAKPQFFRQFDEIFRQIKIKVVCKTFALPRESAKPIASRSVIDLTENSCLL